MSDPWDPPLDLSGGYFISEYSDGAGHAHRQRLHIDFFNTLTLDYTTPSGTETNVADTVAAWYDIWKLFWTANWTISLVSLFQWQSGVLVELIPPAVSPVVGVHSSGESDSQAGVTTWSFKTVDGHKAKILFIAPSIWAPAAPVFLTSASAGNDGTAMTYLTGTDTKIVGKDGSRLVDYVHAVTDLNDRLRRRYRLD